MDQMLSHLIWDEYDQRMLQMDREDQAMAGQERFPEARFKREYLVFKFGQFTANRILELKDSTELPNNSILHVFDNISHLDEPPLDIPRIDEQPFIDRESFRKFIYHIRDFNLEGPINYSDKYIFRQSGLPANLLKFRSQHGSRFRYLNSLEEIPPRREALSIINHNPLFRVRMFGRLQTYRRLTLIFTSILNTVCALQKYNKNQFLYIPWGPEVYDRSLFIRNRTDLSIVSIKRPEDPHYFFMMHLVNFLWEDATTSIFKKLPEDILSQITLILNAGNKYLFYNLKDLVDLNQHKNKIYFKCLNQLNMLSLVGRTNQDITPNEDTIINDAIKKSVVSSKEGENTTEITVIEPNVSASESENTNTQEIDTAPSQHDSAVENIINKAVKTINNTVAPTPTTRGVATAPITEITKSPAPSIIKKELKELTQTKKLDVVVEKDKVKPNTPAPTDMKEIVSEYMREGDREALEFIENNENLSIGQKRRYERLANKYKEIKVGDKTIAQIISESDDIALHPEVIEADKVGDIPDKSALKSSVISFDKTYMEKSFDKHLLEAIVSFRKNGAYLTDLKVEHENDRMNNFVHYTCKYEDINGKTSTVKFRLPQITRDGRIRIDGNYQILKKQRINLPIVKISDTEVSLASNYNKTRIERNINKAHNYFSYIDNLINNNEKSTAVIEYGNCWINLPLAYEYSTISERYRHITFRKDNVNWDLWFDYKTREDHFDGKLEQMTALESQYGTYFGKTNNEWLFIDNQNRVFAINKRGGEIPDWKYSDLLSILELSLKEGVVNKKQLTEYVNIKILDKMLPVIFLLGFRYGLRRTLDYLGVKYVITEPRTRVIVGSSGMEDYEAGMTSFNPDYGKVTRLHEIYDSMKDFDYGMWDRSTNKPMDRKWFDNDAEDIPNNTEAYMWKNHRILTPEETAKYKLGTCWEQAIYTAYMCDKYKIRWKMLWYDYCNYYTDIKEYYPGCHTTIITEINDNYYWIEHAWWSHRGVRKYETFDECINDIIKNHVIKMNSATKPADCPNGQPTGVMSIGFVDNGRIRNFYNDRNITQQKFFNAMPPCAIYDHTAQRDRYFQHIEVKSPLSVKVTFTNGKTQVFNAKIPTGKPFMASMAEFYGTESFEIDTSKIDANAIASNEGLLMKWFEFNMWIYRKLYSTWAKLNKYDDVVFVWCNGKVNPKKNAFVFNSASIAYWDPKLTKPMKILQKLYEVEDKEYRIVVPKRLPIIKTWKGNFLYINDILKLLPDFARDVKKYAKIDKEYKTLFDKNMYAFFWTVHKSLIDYLKSRGCELYVDKTIKEKEDVHGNKYREGNEAFDNESLPDNFILTDQFIKPLWKEVLDRYQQSVGFDLSHMSYEISDQSHHNDGKSSDMTAQEWAGNWTKNQIIYLNTHALEAYKHFEQKTPDLITFKLFMKSIIAHELAHEVLANLAKEEYKRRIIDQAKELQFTTNYLQAIKNSTSDKNKYESELFCEFLAFEVLNDTANKLIDSRLTANTAIANTTERRYTPQSGDISIRFADRVLWFNRYPLDKSLIVSGLDYFDCEQYELSALESPDIYYRMLQDKGLSTNYLKGISSFFDLFVDNMTYEVLRRMGEPTTVRGLLARAAQMLSTLDYRPPSSRENHRLRGMEQVPALVYNEMSRQFAAYQARRGKANSFAINPDAIFLRFISNASLVTSEDTNPIRCLEEKSEMTYAGAGGRSSDSFVLRDRAYAVDDIGVISEATVDNYKVAINAQLSLNAGITDTLGTLKSEDINTLQPADVLSNAALLLPFSTNDDKLLSTYLGN